jgi:RimJ/RimL family protein N-acetyltransferase
VTNVLSRIAWPVVTDRLTLRPAVAGDASAAWVFRRLPEVTEWMTSAPATEEEFSALFCEPDRLSKTLLIEREDTVIGDLMVAVEDAWAQTEVAERARGTQAELGWCLDPAFQGHGYATEAVAALIRLCFVDLGLRRIIANSFADNTASRRVMERLGMRLETHTVAESLHRAAGWLDGVSYALLAEEWRASQH